MYAFGESASGELDKLPKLWATNPAVGDKAQLLNFQRDHKTQPPVPNSFGDMKSSYINKIKQSGPGATGTAEPTVMNRNEP